MNDENNLRKQHALQALLDAVAALVADNNVPTAIARAEEALVVLKHIRSE